MLARLLRFTIAMQMAFGAALGYWVCPGSTLSDKLLYALLFAVATPWVIDTLAVIVTLFKSRAEEPFHYWRQAMLGECLANLQFFLLRQPWTVGPAALQASHSAQPRLPVLLVHGLLCNHRVWDLLVPALRAQGHTVLAVDLEPLFTSIDDYAPQLEQAVQTLRRQSGQSQVALVGHSMGGLAIRAWLRRYGTAHVARVVTLGTPHAGTRATAWFDTANGLQMAWQSDWLKTLGASETDTTRQLFQIALSPQDNVVYPQREQTLAGVAPAIFEGVGHVQLCASPKVREWVCQQLLLR